MKRFTVSLFLLIVALFPTVSPAVQGSAPVSITVLHLNDTHGHILPFPNKTLDERNPVGGAARFARMIQDARAVDPEGTLLLSAGDMFQGTPISNLHHGRPVIEIMNGLRFDAMVVGNHEFDWGQNVLHEMISQAEFPFLSCNIKDMRGGSPQGIKPYIILSRKGLKIAIIGTTTTETPYSTKPGNAAGLAFEDPAKLLPSLIAEVRSQGAGLVILLSHLGLNADEALAAKVSGIDVIVGGHSHTVVPRPVRIGKTLIVQAGSYGMYLGVLRLTVDPASGTVSTPDADELSLVSSAPGLPIDEKTDSIVKMYYEKIKEEFSRPAGSSLVDLQRNPREESNVGDLVTDAMREASGADIAFQNGGGIRADLPHGELTMEAVFTLLPFDNMIVTMDLTGEQIRRALSRSIDGSRQILQVSGLRFLYDPSKPAGNRITDIALSTGPLVPDKTYRVAVNDFLAAGGDGFTEFKEGRNPLVEDSLRDAVVSYLKTHSPVSPRIEGRILSTQAFRSEKAKSWSEARAGAKAKCAGAVGVPHLRAVGSTALSPVRSAQFSVRSGRLGCDYCSLDVVLE